MKRLILLALIATPLIALALDRLGRGPADARDDRTSHLAFAFPEPPTPPVPPTTAFTPAPPATPVAHVHPADDELPTCCFEDAAGANGDPDSGTCVVESPPMANPDRARARLREAIDDRVSDWLADAGIPRSWAPPRAMVERMIRGRPAVRGEDREYATVYFASVPVELSRPAKHELVREYHRQEGARRLGQLGSVFGFVLACLAVVAGYIRTDEATKGYYTNRLRLLAAAGVGAAGVVLYRMLV
jgi:hypothetical protein